MSAAEGSGVARGTPEGGSATYGGHSAPARPLQVEPYRVGPTNPRSVVRGSRPVAVADTAALAERIADALNHVAMCRRPMGTEPGS